MSTKPIFLFLRILTLVLCLAYLGLTPQTALSATLFSVPLSQTTLDEARALFPEGKAIAPEWLSHEINPNIHFYREASLTLTFLDEVALYKNQLGYFLFEDENQNGHIEAEEILHREILFQNSSKIGSGGSLSAGDSVKIGPFPAGTHLGFFLVANGFQKANGTYYTLDELNPGGERHLAMAALKNWEQVILGIEDRPLNSSDRDYNDVLFSFATDPKNALEEFIEENNIPAPERPTPTPTPTPSPSPQVQASPEVVVNPPPQEVREVTLVEANLPEAPDQLTGPALYFQGSGTACQLKNLSSPQNTSKELPLWLMVFLFPWVKVLTQKIRTSP